MKHKTPYKQLDKLFVTHRVPLVNTLTVMTDNRVIAEGLAQEAYLQLRHQLKQGEIIDKPKNILFQTARHMAVAYQHLLTQQAQVKKLNNKELPQNTPSLVNREKNKLPTNTNDHILLNTLSTLGQRQQKVFILNRMHHWSHSHIAWHLGISERTVQKDVERAMGMCAHHLKEQLLTQKTPQQHLQ